VPLNPENGLFAIGSSDKMIFIYSFDTKKIVNIIEGHSSAVTSIIHIPDFNKEYIISGGGDHMIYLWSITSKKSIKEFSGHTGWIEKLIYLKDYKANLFASCSWDNLVFVWDITSGNIIQKFSGHSAIVTHLNFFLNNHNELQLISASSSNYDKGSIFIWSLKTDNTNIKLQNNSSGINCLEVIKKGEFHQFLICAEEKMITLWHLEEHKIYNTFFGHSASITCLSYFTLLKTESRNSQHFFILSGSNFPENLIKVWDPSSGSCVATLKGHTKKINVILDLSEVCQLPGIIASGGDDGRVIIWNVFKENSMIENIYCFDKGVGVISIIKNNGLVVGANDGSIQLINFLHNKLNA
jgi:WD40 repeat protein